MATEHAHHEDVVLCPSCTGAWLVTTKSGSMHLLDLDVATVSRVPDPGRLAEWLDAGHRRPGRDENVAMGSSLTPAEAAILERDDRHAASGLRGDGEAIALHGFTSVRIGESVRLAVQACSDPAVVTNRVTTPVVSVRRLSS